MSLAPNPSPSRSPRRLVAAFGLLLALIVAALLAAGSPAGAAPTDEPAPPATISPIEPIEPIQPIQPEDVDPEALAQEAWDEFTENEAGNGTTTLAIDVPGSEDSSSIVVIILLLTVLSVAPSLLILMTSFTRIVIILSLTRNALGLPQLPPQQVIVGLSLFLTLFVMGPTFEVINAEALQPLLSGEIELGEALERAAVPLREFMLANTREPELKLFLDAGDVETPIARDEIPLTSLVPAFILSELKAAFILGFAIFVPFLVIDLVVSAVLVSLGMMMLPPTFVSLPLKLLLFILLDGWTLVVGTILNSS